MIRTSFPHVAEFLNQRYGYLVAHDRTDHAHIVTQSAECYDHFHVNEVFGNTELDILSGITQECSLRSAI